MLAKWSWQPSKVHAHACSHELFECDDEARARTNQGCLRPKHCLPHTRLLGCGTQGLVRWSARHCHPQ